MIIPQASSTVIFELGLPEEELDVKGKEKIIAQLHF